MIGRGCAFEGCPQSHYAKGWCRKHWLRVSKHGDANHGRGTVHNVDDPACTSRFDGVCCCLTAGQVRDYVEGGDNARWLALPTQVEGAA